MSSQTRSGFTASKLLVAFLPLAGFLALAAIFYSLLATEGRDTTALPSALLNEPAPQLTVPALEGLSNEEGPVPGIDADTFSGKLSVVNIFASWCVPCRDEHPQIVDLGQDDRWQVIGINHKDNRTNALSFLAELGNPFDIVGVDRNGRASIEWGVYGVPETFLVGPDGVIFYKHVGPITKANLESVIKPLLEQRLADTN